MSYDKLVSGTNLWIERGHETYKVFYNHDTGANSMIFVSRDLTHVELFIDGFKAALHYVNGVEFRKPKTGTK